METNEKLKRLQIYINSLIEIVNDGRTTPEQLSMVVETVDKMYEQLNPKVVTNFIPE